GPLAGPLEEWTIREGRVKTRGARIRTIRIDEADVALGSGSLSKISFQGSARSGQDVVQAEGFFRWTGKPEVEATINASAADAAPYLSLIQAPPSLKCKDLHAAGKLLVQDGTVSFEGGVTAGAGEVERIAWKGATINGSFGADRIDAKE